MTLEQFKSLVAQMRAAQKEYFRTRDRNVLQQSKILEKQVDDALKEDIQQTLF